MNTKSDETILFKDSPYEGVYCRVEKLNEARNWAVKMYRCWQNEKSMREIASYEWTQLLKANYELETELDELRRDKRIGDKLIPALSTSLADRNSRNAKLLQENASWRERESWHAQQWEMHMNELAEKDKEIDRLKGEIHTCKETIAALYEGLMSNARKQYMP